MVIHIRSENLAKYVHAWHHKKGKKLHYGETSFDNKLALAVMVVVMLSIIIATAALIANVGSMSFQPR